MTHTLEIKNAEKQVFRLALFDDGIWEIYLGLFFLLMSFYSLTRELLGPALNGVLFLGLSILFAFAAVTAKIRIIQPRIGFVKFGSETKKKIKSANIVVMSLVLVTFILLILGANSLLNEPTWEGLPQWLSDFDVDLVFALITVAIFSLIAYYTGVARFYLHGVLLGVGNFATAVLHVYKDVQFGWPLALAGLIIAMIGVTVLIKFLRDHPTPDGEVINE
jgi:hypothetical protein